MTTNPLAHFEVKTIDGTVKNMADYNDKILLIVNTASKCGFTSQYAQLEELYQKYKEREFLILGFPCNQFGGQEPGDGEEIKQFCSLNFNVTFPLFCKIEVNGPQAHPLFNYLKKDIIYYLN